MFGAFISGGLFEDVWDVWDVEEMGLEARYDRIKVEPEVGNSWRRQYTRTSKGAAAEMSEQWRNGVRGPSSVPCLGFVTLTPLLMVNLFIHSIKMIWSKKPVYVSPACVWHFVEDVGRLSRGY